MQPAGATGPESAGVWPRGVAAAPGVAPALAVGARRERLSEVAAVAAGQPASSGFFSGAGTPPDGEDR